MSKAAAAEEHVSLIQAVGMMQPQCELQDEGTERICRTVKRDSSREGNLLCRSGALERKQLQDGQVNPECLLQYHSYTIETIWLLHLD